MGKESVKFHDVEIEKKEFHCSKSAIPISHVSTDNVSTDNVSTDNVSTDNVSTDKIVMSEAFPCAKKGSKYFGGYKDNEDVTPFRSMLCNFIEIALWHGCSPVDLVRMLRTPLKGCSPPLYILLPKTTWYLKNFDDAKTMSFSVEDEKPLKKYNEI